MQSLFYYKFNVTLPEPYHSSVVILHQFYTIYTTHTYFLYENILRTKSR